MPRSTICPPSTTRIWSAARTVDSRWAMTSDVRPASAVASARWIAASDSESRCAVASSSTTTDGALSSSRARARRCFSPPENRCPRSPAIVSNPSGSDEISSQIRAAWQASISSFSVADGRAYARLARIVSWNRYGSCGTTPTSERSDSSVRSRTSCPPIRTAPRAGSYSRGTRCVIVVFPAPDGPTSAVSFPAGAWKVTSRSTHASLGRSGTGSATGSSEGSDTWPASGYLNHTPATSTPGASRLAVSGCAAGRSVISGSRSRISKTRSKPTSAVRMSSGMRDTSSSGPYSCDTSAMKATSVPTWNTP